MERASFGDDRVEQHAPAVVATQQFYVGPGQQGAAMKDGFDQEVEDELFEKIKGPAAGYRLFEIGSFVVDRDWFDGVWESNCIFAPRAALEQAGSFDESFDEAGGSYANLELYERLGSAPGVTVCSMIGEGSFHQVHGGTTTNQIDDAVRRARVFGYAETFAELRGRKFKGPGRPLHYVGRIPTDAARWSKPRRVSPRAFLPDPEVDGVPTVPSPMSAELAAAFTEASWRTLPWENATWLGEAMSTPPTDLLAYREILAGIRPDFVVVTGSDRGRVLYLASICDLIDHGTVLSVGSEGIDHPRVTMIDGPSDGAATGAAVAAVVGDSSAVVVLGSSADRATTFRQFKLYEPLIAVGSYAVVVNKIYNGHPVWPGFGPGPGEGVKQILGEYGSFAIDESMEKYGLTFSPGGFLKRVN